MPASTKLGAPRAIGAAVATAVAVAVAGCASLPPPTGRTPSTALTDTAQTRLGRALAADVAAHPGTSGVATFLEPRDAFAGRIVLTLRGRLLADAVVRRLLPD